MKKNWIVIDYNNTCQIFCVEKSIWTAFAYVLLAVWRVKKKNGDLSPDFNLYSFTCNSFSQVFIQKTKFIISRMKQNGSNYTWKSCWFKKKNDTVLVKLWTLYNRIYLHFLFSTLTNKFNLCKNKKKQTRTEQPKSIFKSYSIKGQQSQL